MENKQVRIKAKRIFEKNGNVPLKIIDEKGRSFASWETQPSPTPDSTLILTEVKEGAQYKGKQQFTFTKYTLDASPGLSTQEKGHTAPSQPLKSLEGKPNGTLSTILSAQAPLPIPLGKEILTEIIKESRKQIAEAMGIPEKSIQEDSPTLAALIKGHLQANEQEFAVGMARAIQRAKLYNIKKVQGE